MMEVLFFTALIAYFFAVILQIVGVAVSRPRLTRAARCIFAAALLLHTAFTVWRGVAAARLPLAKPYEFSSGFAWAAAVLGFVLYRRLGQEWLMTVSMPVAFLVLSYAAFAVAACCGLRYLLLEKKETDAHLRQLDNLSYKLVCFGYLMLTVVILTGCVWAEQAWSSFWTWDPKEVWALITWILYSIYLHQRIHMNWRGRRMAFFSILAFVFVIFTFVGVNTLMSGLHSYA